MTLSRSTDSNRRILQIALLCMLLGALPPGWAWSASVHADLAKAAYAQLTPNQQTAYVRLLKGNKISKPNYRPAAQIGYLARWPDHLRNISVQDIFRKYGSGEVPRALAAYSGQNTNDWHFENVLYVDDQQQVREAGKRQAKGRCPPPRNGQLLTVWPKLLKAYKQSTDSRDKSILLAFILHAAGDAHQPLHLMAGLKPDCKHDAGGNGFCVDAGLGRFTYPKERCKLNLHQAWDRGFGLFDKRFSADPVKQKAKAQNLNQVVSLHRSWAADVYPSEERPFGSAAYQVLARQITQQAASRAVAHQTQLLRELAPK